MPSFYQKTIKREIQFHGVGLHSGKKVNMKLVPAAPNHGIVFKRTDLKTQNLIFSGEGSRLNDLKKIVNSKLLNNIFDANPDNLKPFGHIDREFLACYGAAKILTEGFIPEAFAIPNKSQRDKSGLFTRIFNIFN